MTLLFDMDGPLIDTNDAVTRDIARYLPYIEVVPTEALTQFYLPANYPPEHRDAIIALIHREGFFRELEPRAGAIEALNEALLAGEDPTIVTAPVALSPTCASEKLDWVRHHLGNSWLDRIVITRDKTCVHGDVLYDDRGHITGRQTPSWRHIIYDAPHNQGILGPRMIDVSQWCTFG